MEHAEHMTEQESLIHDRAAEMRNGGSWFYWIAGLSIVNSLIVTFGGNWGFFLGLGITQLIDSLFAGVAQGTGVGAFQWGALAINLVISGVFAGFGYFARRGASWAFILGIFLYILDALLYLTFGGYLAFAFHLFALFFMVKGLIGSRRFYQGED
ncbi:MAG: hypothetical protein R2747_22455 [Pyrinomonadaceae bacterium]